MQDRNVFGRDAVFSLLKTEAPVSADALAARLNLTPMAVRQHLSALRADGLAVHTAEARPRGRPVQMWRLTPQADAHFTDSHSALPAELIAPTRKLFGEEGLNRLIKARTADQEKAYRARTDPVPSLKAKLDRLARLRSEEGYM